MPSILTVTGRDVLFAHWPVDPDRLAERLPGPLGVDTFDGSARVSALALENRAVAPGSASPPAALTSGFPQLNLRTYVTLDGEPGVYFLSLDTGRRSAAAVGRRAFGLPFFHARMRMTRHGETVTFRSRRTGGDDPPRVFEARYRPDGPRYRAEPGSLEAFCIEHDTYYLPVPEDRRPGLFGSADRGEVVVGTIERDPWDLRPVDATIHENTLLAAAGLPTSEDEPVVQYSPGFEMGVRPVERRSVESSDGRL